jgi:hypothetical protein
MLRIFAERSAVFCYSFRFCLPFLPHPYLSQATVLLGFLVVCVLTAESAVFFHFKSVGIVFLVFHRVVIALFVSGLLYFRRMEDSFADVI